MTTTSFTEAVHAGEFLITDGDGGFSREKVTVASGAGVVTAGTVIGKQTVSTTVASPVFAGTGNGGITMDSTNPVQLGAIVGAYVALCTSAATNSGEFEVTDPNGHTIGSVKVGATFNNQLKFVIADGSSDYVVGDKYTITIAAGTGKVVPVPAVTAFDGSSIPVGILFATVDATSADAVGAMIARHAEVDGGLLTYSTTSISGLTNTQLGGLGIIVR